MENTDYPNTTLTNVIKVHLYSYLEKLLSMLDNRLCLKVKAFTFQTNLVTISSTKRKRNAVTIERKLETIYQLGIRVRVSFLAVSYNIVIVIQLSEPSLVPINLDNLCPTVCCIFHQPT